MSDSVNGRPTVLTFVRYYLPGHKSGGPIRTIANLVAILGEEFHFKIITLDRDATDTSSYQGIVSDSWCARPGCDVWYCSSNGVGLRALARIAKSTPHSIVYLNGFFDHTFTIPYLLLRFLRIAPGRSTIIAPRGEFSAAALKLKARRKRVYLTVAKAVGLLRNVTWQASSELEAQDIRAALGAVAESIVVAPNLPTPVRRPAPPPIVLKPAMPLRIVFLSRIAPMKNLAGALRTLSEVDVPVDFHIYGHVSDPTYWNECQRVMRRLPSTVTVTNHGSIANEFVSSALASCDLFFLPTLGENYGHAIVEALQAGVPVLISDRTPWLDLESYGAGWAFPLEQPDSFKRVIESVAVMPPEQYGLHAAAAAAYGLMIGEKNQLVEASRALLQGGTSRAPRYL